MEIQTKNKNSFRTDNYKDDDLNTEWEICCNERKENDARVAYNTSPLSCYGMSTDLNNKRLEKDL